MASAVDICNAGLSHVGARAQISAISPPDGSVEAGYCARFYPLARREMLEAHAWSFALKRVALASVANESTAWAYAYAKPSDCLVPRRVLPILSAEASDILAADAGSARFTVEGDVIFTNEPDAVLVYTREVADTNKFSPGFVTALGMLMAGYLAGPIIKGVEGARAAVQWRRAAMDAAAAAAAINANGAHDRNDFVPAHLAARA